MDSKLRFPIKNILFYALLFFTQSIASQSYNSLSDIYDCKSSKQKSSNNSFKIYISGELHHKRYNDKIRLELFKRLYKIDSVRIFISEIGYCEGIVLNDYLKNNNPLCIKFASLNEEIEFANGLKSFYDSLPTNDKFFFYGIDYEKGMYRYLLPAIKALLPKTVQDSSLASTKMLLNAISRMPDDNSWGGCDPKPFITVIEADIINNEVKMQNYWKEHYYDIKKIIYQYNKFNTVAPKNFSGTGTEKYSEREEYIYTNIKELQQKYPNKKMFGQFGRAHIPITKQIQWGGRRSTFINWESFAAKLNTREDSPFKNAVCSFFIYYPKTIIETRKNVPIDKKDLIKLEKLSPNKQATLFNLKCIDSSLYGNTVKNAFQYLIINKY